MCAGWGIQTFVRQHQPLNLVSAQQVLLDDLGDVFRPYKPVPHRLRINDHRVPVFALVEAARFICPDADVQPRRPDLILEDAVKLSFALTGARWTCRAGFPVVCADKNVAFEFRQSKPRFLELSRIE